MGMLEIIVGILLFLLLVNLAFSLVPIPGGIVGLLVAVLIIVLIWRLVF